MVTYYRKELLINNIELLRKAFLKVKQNYEFEIVAICVFKRPYIYDIKRKRIEKFL